MFNNKKTVESIISEKIISQLGENPMQWVKTWRPARANGHPHMPMYNYRTGYGYNLINCLLMEDEGAYVSAKDLLELGGNVVIDGKKYRMTSDRYFPKEAKDLVRIGIRTFRKTEAATDKEGNLVIDDDGKPKMKMWVKHNYFYALNVKYTDLPEKPRKDEHFDVFPTGSDALENARLLAETYQYSGGPDVIYDGVQASYSPMVDIVRIPKPKQFVSVNEYYSTLFHELGHSTGASKRLNRDQTGSFGSRKYAKEELIAELFAAMCCAACGIDTDGTQTNSVGYIQSWKQVLTDDPSIIFSACSAAEYAFGYVMDMLPETAKESEAVTVPAVVTAPAEVVEPYMNKYRDAYVNCNTALMHIEGDDPKTGSHVWFSLNMDAVLMLPLADFRKAWKSISPFMTDLQKDAVYALSNGEWERIYHPEMAKCKAIIKPAAKGNKKFKAAVKSVYTASKKLEKNCNAIVGIADGKLYAGTSYAVVESSPDDYEQLRELWPMLPEKLDHPVRFQPVKYCNFSELSESFFPTVNKYMNVYGELPYELATQTDEDLENKRIRYSFPGYQNDYAFDKSFESIAKKIGKAFFTKFNDTPALRSEGNGMRYIAMPIMIR